MGGTKGLVSRDVAINGAIAALFVMLGWLGLSVGHSVRRAGVPVGPPPGAILEAVPGWTRMIESGRRLGPSDADVVLMVFSDYECPFCRSGAATLETLQAEFPEELAIVVKHYPLQTIHSNAYAAARLAECAADQGRFARAHFYLLRSDLDGVDPEEVARGVEVKNPTEFERCSADRLPHPAIEQDLSDAREVGTRRTPTYVLQGRVLAGTPDATVLAGLVTQLLNAGQ